MQASFEFVHSQRWFEGRTNFRLSREPINPAQYSVKDIGYAIAKVFVSLHHYSGTFPPCIQSYGLFRQDSPFSAPRLVGVATFSPASNPKSIKKWSGLNDSNGAELGRLILLDEVPGNAESWFLARALDQFKAKKPLVQLILSYSDPVARTNLRGESVFVGHWGCVYQSSNALYLGRASPKTQYLNAEGRVIANRLFSKIRNGEVGRQYAEDTLSEVSGIAREPEESSSSYVERALGALRPQSHPGNHLYAFPLAADRREKMAILNLPVLQSHSLGIAAYPKRPDFLMAA